MGSYQGGTLDKEIGAGVIAVAGTSVELPTSLSRVLNANFQEVSSETGQTIVLMETVTSTSTGTSVGFAAGTSVTVGLASAGSATAALTFFYTLEGKS